MNRVTTHLTAWGFVLAATGLSGCGAVDEERIPAHPLPSADNLCSEPGASFYAQCPGYHIPGDPTW